MLLRDFYRNFYRPRRLREAAESTLRLWSIALNQFDQFVGCPAALADLTDDQLSAFALARGQTVSAPTVNRDLASLLALWRYAHRQGLIDQWPTVQLCREPRRVPVAWTQEEFCRLMVAIGRLEGQLGDWPKADWWRALMLVLFDSGERIGAALGLEWPSVDLSGRWVVFTAETRKGRREDSIVAIAEDTATALSRIAKSRGPVFPWPYHSTYIWDHLAKILETAGLPADRKRKFHCVRRTVASYVEANGGNATNVLRHASRRTTMAYLDPRIVKSQQAVDVVPWRPE